MNKNELIRAVATKNNLSVRHTAKIINSFIEESKLSLIKTGRINNGIGVIKIIEYKGIGYDFHKKKSIEVDSKRFTFKPSMDLHKRIKS